MFNPQQLHDVLALHEKSFALLRWVRASLKSGQLSFAVVHSNTDTASAASEWIARHLQNFPHEARPAVDQVPTFSRLFVSFLVTSYKLRANAVRLTSDCGCYCSYCAYLRAGPLLEPRSPSKKDFQTAHELKQLYLGRLVGELESGHPSAAVSSLLSTKELAESISMATWGAELVRRSEFASQGEAVLALWRQFAWRENSPKPKYRLTAPQLLAAEQAVVVALRTQPS